MIDQPELFAWKPPPSQRHSETSIAAAESVKGFTNILRKRVLDYIESKEDGATDEEIALALKMEGNTERPRRVELLDRGLIKDSGSKRNTVKGRKAVVWIKA